MATTFAAVLRPQIIAARRPLIIALVLTSISGLAISLQNVFPKWLFSEVLEREDASATERWRALAMLLGGYLVVSLIVRMACWHIGYRIFTRTRERIVFHVRAELFRHMNNLCLRFHGKHPSGELHSYLFGSPLGNIVSLIQQCTMMLPHTSLAMLSTLVLFWRWDAVVAVTLMATSVISVLMMDVSRRRVQGLWKVYQQTEGEVSGRVGDLLRGSRAVKLYAMEPSADEEFVRNARRIGDKSVERDILSHYEWMKQEAIGYVAFSLLVSVCAWRYLAGHIDLGTVAACLTSFASLQWPLQVLYQIITQYGAATASAQRIDEVFRTVSGAPDPAEGAPAPAQGELRLDGVTFSYDSEPVLRSVDVTIPVGQRVALVGPSGAGKSTIVQLLLRLYDPQEGSVRFAGIDVRRLRGRELRQRFGIVPQDPFIFQSTIRDNLRVTRPEASDDDLRRACERANAWEFIAQLPQGLDTPVGEAGTTLSGGQRQRLAIARALLAEPSILVFDEATSALDTVSERLIQQAIERNLGGRTAIFIAHRLATVRDCDRILVVDGGRIVQDGDYDTLLAQPGLFRELVAGQSLRGVQPSEPTAMAVA